MDIVYEDNHVIAVVKPHGQAVQGDKSGDLSLLDEVKQFIKTRDNKPGNVFLGLIHRLDRPVGGVVIFAKTSKGASRLSEQFRNHTVEKVYLAKVEGEPKEKSGEVVQWLKKDTATNIVTAFDREVAGSKLAELSYRALGNGIIEIHPKTGRPHQIRVAMKTLGTPIVGDSKYGAKSKFPRGLALWAKSLAFDQPVTKERIVVETSPQW